MNFLMNVCHGKSSIENVKAIRDFYQLKALDIDKNEISFEQFKGQVVLVTNVASK